MRTEGDLVRRMLWVEDAAGEEIHSREEPEQFRIANKDQTREFYVRYKQRQGWQIGKVYTLRDRDYPLLLIDFEFDLVSQSMLYVFCDLNDPTAKLLKTHNEEILEFVEKWEEEATLSSFVADETCRLDHEVTVSITRDPAKAAGWSVSGRSFSFESSEKANREIQCWIDRMRVRRVASVLQTAKQGTPAQVTLSSEGNLYITSFEKLCGQPAIFVSRTAAALALVFLGEKTWKSALGTSLDSYDI